MRIVYIVLLVYCSIAIIVSGYLIHDNSEHLASFNKLYGLTAWDLEFNNEIRQEAATELNRLETQLRRERMESSGDQAIQLSMLVQEAQAELDAINLKCNQLNEELDGYSERQQDLRGHYLPLVLLLLLHIVGALVVLSFLRPKL